jgi:hypothetical protein
VEDIHHTPKADFVRTSAVNAAVESLCAVRGSRLELADCLAVIPECWREPEINKRINFNSLLKKVFSLHWRTAVKSAAFSDANFRTFHIVLDECLDEVLERGWCLLENKVGCLL